MSSTERRTMWQRLLAEQHASGLSVTAWCGQHDIREATFYYWRKQLGAPTPVKPEGSWLPVSLPSTAGQVTLRIGHVAIEVPPGFDPRLLDEVLTALEARC